MKCPKCQSENREEAKFCDECGHNLISIHDASPLKLSVDEKIEKIQRYLPKGLTEKILAQRDKIEGERKQVTVMFCDMEGFSPLVEKLGPEEAYGVMDQVYEILIHKVREYDGTVNEMTGDGIMALFGAPIAMEDAPQRALRSSLAIHREMAQFWDKLRENKHSVGPLRMRIGIHTGPVVVGTLGNDLRVEFKAVGDTVNLASRMEGLAEPGTTYVTKETFQLTRSLLHFEHLGEQEVKGREKAVSVYKLLSAKEDVYRPRLGSERMIYSEMVGRNEELSRLELQVMKLINGEGSIVNIIGEAGIGKSRLVAELKTRDLMKRVTLLEGRAISMGRNLPFHPIIDLLKQWARIREDDAEAKAFEKLETAVRNVCPEDFYEVLPFVATLMGMRLSGRHAERVKGIEGEALEKLILKNVRDFLIKATELTPLVLVAEDLHWADTTSLQLFEAIFRLAQTHRVVFINVFRPGYWQGDDRKVETLPEWLPEAYFVEIAIKPLGRQTGEAMVNNMLQVKGISHVVKQQIVDRSGGNPFFIEEVVRSLIDEGAIVRTNGVFEVTEKIDHVVIPSTINDVLMARIDRLEEQTRDLIKIASVIGRSFFDRILKEVVASIEGVDERLSYLKDAQFIRDHIRMEELEYLFKHALAQEAAYESTLIQQRKALHHKVAQSIEKVFRERLHEFYGMLAFHYNKADELEKAEQYMVKAGDEALRSCASSEALHYFQEALQLYLTKYGKDADPAKLANFEKNIGIALHNKALWAKAVEYLDKVLERWGTPLPKRGLLGMIKLSWDLLVMMKMIYLISPNSKKIPGDRDLEVIELFYRAGVALAFFDNIRQFQVAMAMLRRMTKFDLSKIPGVTGYWAATASIFSVVGFSFKVSKRLLEVSRRYRVGEDIGDRMLYAAFSTVIHSFQGAWGKIKDFDEDLLNSSLRIGDFWHTSLYVIFCGMVKGLQGRSEHLMKAIGQLYKIGETYDYSFAIVNARFLKALYLVETRSTHEALSEAELGISYSREKSTELYEMVLMAYKAEAQQLAGDAEGARDSISQALEIYEKQPSTVMSIFVAEYLVARLFVDIEQLKHAIRSEASPVIEHLRTRVFKIGKAAVRISRKYAPCRTKILKLMGLYYWLIGEQSKALKWWDNAIQEGERLSAKPDLSRTYFEVGKRLLEPQCKYKELNGIEGKGYLEKAGILFEEMGLERDLDDLERLKSGYGL